MKIVILDGHDVNPGDLSWDELKGLGDLTVYEELPDGRAKTAAKYIGDAQIVIANKVHISREVLDACPNIRFISVTATGYDSVNAKYARTKGIPVSNLPHYGTNAVAQHTIALLLEITNHVSLHDLGVHAGHWEASGQWCYWESPLTELAGKTMGIIGFGDIGQQVGRIAGALGMNVLAYSRSVRAGAEKIGTYVSLDTLLAQSDVISLHCPLFPETREIISRENIAKMKEGAILLNTARGGLVDEAALADALISGHILAAAVDVVSAEPITGRNPLRHVQNCIITPHIAWVPKETRERVIRLTAQNVRAFLQGNPINVVNPAQNNLRPGMEKERMNNYG